MKYNKNNKPLVCMMTNSTCYKNTDTMTIKGVLWHSTGANNPTLKRYVQPSSNDKNYNALIKQIGKNNNNNSWNQQYVEAGVNAWIGELADGTVTSVQTLPWNYRPWGVADGRNGSCNDGWIQFEIAESDLNNKSYFEKVYKEACELTAYLCVLYGLNPKGTVKHKGVNTPVVLCHYDSYKLGLGSGHEDVYHWFNKHGKDMDDVRNDVEKLMKSIGANTSISTPSVESNKPNEGTNNGQIYRIRKSWDDSKSQVGAFRNLASAKAECNKFSGYKVFDENGNLVYPISYNVKITADALRIRSGAGTNFAQVGLIDGDALRYTYTIVEEASGQGASKWGLLKAYENKRNGWISLDYVKKV